MTKKVVPVFFDLETQKLFEEVDNDTSRLQYSVAVIRENKRNYVYWEKQHKDLLEHLDRAGLIVGHNHIKFDYAVLTYYGVDEERIQSWRKKSYDVLVEIFKIFKQRVSLDHLSKRNVTGAPGKLFDGAECPKLYKEAQQAFLEGNKSVATHNMERLRDLCTDDVERLAKIFGLIIGGKPLKIMKYWDKSFDIIEVTLPIPEGVAID